MLVGSHSGFPEGRYAQVGELTQMPFGIWPPTLLFRASDPPGQVDASGTSGLENRSRIRTDRGRHQSISKTRANMPISQLLGGV